LSKSRLRQWAKRCEIMNALFCCCYAFLL
jgi:hypothetical protein